MTRAPVVFDLDGTLWTCPADAESYSNPRALLAECQFLPGAKRAVLRADADRGVVYLTGRTSAVRAVTMEQLRTLGAPPRMLVMQEAWRGWDAYVEFKVAQLRALRAACYVGDKDIDQEIAAMAGVNFLWPHEVGIGPLSVVSQ